MNAVAVPASEPILIITHRQHSPHSKMEIIRLKDAGPFEPREYLIEKIFPVGVPVMWYAAPGHAKSILAASVAVSLAAGIPWLGKPVVQTPVIFVDMELTRRESHHRFHRVARGAGLDDIPEDVYYIPGYELGYSLNEVLAGLEEVVGETGARLIILDSLSLALEADATDARTTIRAIKTAHWLEEYKACLLLLDHQGKIQQGESYSSKSAYGSVFKRALARDVEQLKVDGHIISFRCDKNNFSDTEGTVFSVSVEWNNDTEGPIVFSKAVDTKLKGQQFQIYVALLDGPMSRRELASIDAIGNSGLTTSLKRLLKTGKVTEAGGLWCLTNT